MTTTTERHKLQLVERFKFDMEALEASIGLVQAHERYASANGLAGPVLCSQTDGLWVWVTAPYKAREISTRDIADAPVYVTEFEGFSINVRYVPDAS